MNITTNYSTHFENELIRQPIVKQKPKPINIEIVFADMIHKRVREIKAEVLK